MKLVSLTFLSVGMFLIIQAIMPIIAFETWEMGQKLQSNLISPQTPGSGNVLGVTIENKDNFPAFVSSKIRETNPNYTRFYLTVPSLNIQKEQVLVDSNDLSKSLAHLPGSALPGEKGNVFISGHSALSQVFSLKNAVFSRLSDLKKGDQVIIETPGAKFVYAIESLKVVNPSDVSVINAPEEMGRYVTLMTCVPPGLNFKRLVVLAKML